MIYQLPDGRVINISVEEFLRMDDELEQAYIGSTHGYSVSNPFHQSAISKPTKIEPKVDRSLDFVPDDDNLKSEEDIDLNKLPDEDGFDK